MGPLELGQSHHHPHPMPTLEPIPSLPCRSHPGARVCGLSAIAHGEGQTGDDSELTCFSSPLAGAFLLEVSPRPSSWGVWHPLGSLPLLEGLWELYPESLLTRCCIQSRHLHWATPAWHCAMQFLKIGLFQNLLMLWASSSLWGLCTP